MVLTSLGTRSLDIGQDWQTYNPIFLLSNRRYAIQVLTASANSQFIYSYVLIRYLARTPDNTILRSQPLARIFYDSDRQFFLFDNVQLFQVNDQIAFQAKRISLYSTPSQVADLDLTLAVDPEVNSSIQIASMQENATQG